MDIKQLSKQLRHAADTLDALFEVKGTQEIAKRILKKTTLRGYTYKGKHWTQTPAGKIKLRESMRKMWAKRGK